MNIIQLVRLAGVFSIVVILMKQGERDAYAEGHKKFTGAEGVNRVVRTPSKGFYQVNGGGHMTFSNLPYDVQGNYTGKGKEYVDKPSFYLGGSCGGAQIDAGLQYEPTSLNGIVPGWSAFISDGDKFARPQVWATRRGGGSSVPWRPLRGPATIASGVTFNFNSNHTAQTTIGIIASGQDITPIASNNGTFFWNNKGGKVNKKNVLKAYPNHPIAPWRGQQAFNGKTNKANVKSVIAMTRDNGGSNNDGSQLTGSWSALNITDASGNHTWTKAYVNQGVTGYDSPANGSRDAKDGLGAWKVDFSGLSVTSQVARTNVPGSQSATTGSAAGSPSRYSGETVSIFLRNPPPKGKGKPVHHH